MEILDEEEIKAALVGLPGWSYSNDKVSKEFKFDDFSKSLEFVNSLAPGFEANDHHPDIHILYDRVIFELQRFDMGGKVTDKDIETAADIERAYAELV